MTKPNRIILVRHGESEGNIDRSVYSFTPDYSLGLTRKGREQALDAGEKIKAIAKDRPIKFYVSTHVRTMQTYDGIAKSFDNLPAPYYDPRLREQDWGNLRALEVTAQLEKERDSYGTFHYRFPNGESCADVYDRISGVLDTMHRDWEKSVPDTVCVVTHGMTMRVFLMRWFKWSPTYFEQIRNPNNCQLIVLGSKYGTKGYVLETPLELYKSGDNKIGN